MLVCTNHQTLQSWHKGACGDAVGSCTSPCTVTRHTGEVKPDSGLYAAPAELSGRLPERVGIPCFQAPG